MVVGLVLLGVGLAQTPNSEAVEAARVVELVRQNYAGYLDGRDSYRRPDWEQIERTAEHGTLRDVLSYLAAFRDPDLRFDLPKPKSEKEVSVKLIPRTIRLGGGPELVSLLVRAESPSPLYTPRYTTLLFVSEDLGRISTTTATRIVLDLRRPSAADSRLEQGLAPIVDRKIVTEPGLDVLVSKENLAAWKADPSSLPRNQATLVRMTVARPGSFVTLAPDRTIRVRAHPRFQRVAILVGEQTSPEGSRFVELARQSGRVRVFGSATKPFGLRGIRTFELPSGAPLSVPTFRRRGPIRVVPDEELESLPPDLQRRNVDFIRYRADQWCEFGE